VIDVWYVVSNSIWIAGLVVLLAALSWERWIAGENRTRRQPRLALNLGLILFCAGLAATGRGWWERALWGLLSAVWVARTFQTAK